MISMKTLGKMKRLLLASAALLLLLCGCGGKGQDGIIVEFDPGAQTAEKNVTITLFGFKSDALNLVAIEAALHDFMDANPDIDVTYEGIKGSPYWEALTTRAGTGNMDDIMMVDHDRIKLFTGQGKLADLSGLSTIRNFLPMARSQFTEPDGSIYFLPTYISTYNLYINTDLLEQHGQKLPENLTEFAAVCDYFVKQGIPPIIANNYYSLGSLMVAKGMYPVYQAEDPVAEIQNRVPTDITIAPSAPYLTNGRNVLGSDYNLDFPMDTTLRECGNGIMEGMNVDEAMAVLSSRLYPASDGRGCAEP